MALASTTTAPEGCESTDPNIRVLDDFLPAAAYDALAELISNASLTYGSRSNLRTDPHGHWSRSFVEADRMNLTDVSSDLSRDERLAPLDRAWGFLRDTRFANDILIRCYLNAYTYGTDGYFHIDSQRPDEHTTLLYLNDYWEPDWAGETVFLDAHGDILRSVLPKGNRAIIFPSDVQHAGRGVSRKCTALRKTLIFKTRRRRSSNFERLSAFLRRAGAANHGHKSGTLHDHLVRTFSLLEARGFDESVCLGGGLHAIYGTNTYRLAVQSQRDRAKVVEEFGARAEELASLFAMLERPKALEFPRELTDQAAIVELPGGQTMTLLRTTFDDLRKIECANLADQNELSKHRMLSAIWQAK
jgi:2OG-Fe(II) oxygenase superfamily